MSENNINKTYFRFLNKEFKGIYKVVSEKYPLSEFWKLNDRVVIEDDMFSKRAWIDSNIWRRFTTTFSLEYDEAASIIGDWFNENLGISNEPKKGFLFRKP
jgi:hypothetical protein